MKLEKVEPKKWMITFNDWSLELNLISSPATVTNSFHIVADFLLDMTEKDPDFETWLRNFMFEYTKLGVTQNESLTPSDEILQQSTTSRFDLIISEIETIKSAVDKYINSLEIDFNQFVDMSKAKKSSILFRPPEIEAIIKFSGCMKVYSLISNVASLKLDNRLHKRIYNEFAKNIQQDTDIVRKIYDVVKTKTFRYSITDKFMWDYIRTLLCKEIDDHVIEVFNFIMSSILVLCVPTKNPITYFVGVIDESVKWFLRSVYKDTIIYDDTMSTDELQTPRVDNLNAFCYNDTLGRLKGIAYKKLYAKIENDYNAEFRERDLEDEMTIFQERASSIEFVSPLCECITFPIISRLTNIPYHYFKTLPPEQAAVLTLYTKNLLEKEFGDQFESLFSMLDYFPRDQPSLTTTYIIKNTELYINLFNQHKDFFSFNNTNYLYKALCHFVGRVSRIDFTHLITGKKLGGIPLSKIEEGMIVFYINLFAGGYKKELDNMRKNMNSDF